MKIIPALLVAVLSCPLFAATEVAFKKEGKGPGVVLIHGLGGNREVWTEISKRLRTSHTVLSVDLPGHGESAPPPLKEGEADLDAIAGEIAQLVRKQKIAPAILVGHGLSGAIAMRAALADSGAVRAIILVDSTLTPLSKDYTGDFEKDLDTNPTAAIGGFVGDLCNGETQKAKLVREAMKVPIPVLKAYARALGRDSFAGRGASVRVPVTLFSSTVIPDPTHEKESLVQLGMDGIPKLTVSYFVEVKHWIMWDDPDTFEILFNDFENNLLAASASGNVPKK